MKSLVVLCAVFCAPTVFGASISGVENFTASFSGNSGISFAAVAPNASTSTQLVTSSGPNVLPPALSAIATDFTSFVSVSGSMAFTVGANSQGVVQLEAISGAVRVTNSGGGPGTFLITKNIFHDIHASVPALGSTAVLISFAAIERFNRRT